MDEEESLKQLHGLAELEEYCLVVVTVLDVLQPEEASRDKVEQPTRHFRVASPTATSEPQPFATRSELCWQLTILLERVLRFDEGGFPGRSCFLIAEAAPRRLVERDVRKCCIKAGERSADLATRAAQRQQSRQRRLQLLHPSLRAATETG